MIPTRANAHPVRLAHWGRLLWGDTWQSAMARDLGINLRTVQRWAVGQGAPSDGVWDDMRALARRRIGELKALR